MTVPPDDQRLKVLRETELLDSPPEEAFDRFTRLAARLMDSPVSLVSLVDEQRQFFKSAFGLLEPWAAQRQTPLTHSFCQFAVKERAPLIVEDARSHPLLRDNLAIEELHAVAYAGVPLLVDDQAIGAFCVIDDKLRHWTAGNLEVLQDLAASVTSEIQLPAALRTVSAQRALLEGLVDGVGDAVLAVDRSRKFILANAAAKRLFDAPQVGESLPEDWVRRHRSVGEDGAEVDPQSGALARGLRGLATDGLHITVTRPGLSPVWVEVSGRPIFDAAGQVAAAVGVYRDITERRRQAVLYATLAGQIPNGAVILFDEELKCVAIDGLLARADGHVPQNLIGKTMRELGGNPPDFDAVEDIYRRTLAGESLVFVYPSGGRVLSLHTSPVPTLPGAPRLGFVLAMDVTAQRRTEAALKESEALYRAIVANLPGGGVLLVDRELRYVAADGPAVSAMLQRGELSAIVGCRVGELTPGSRSALLEFYREALDGRSRHLEVARGDRHYDLTVVPVSDGQQVSHALAFLNDVTVRKAELLELERARAALEQASHDLREAAVTDQLTGLLNRRGFLLVAEQQLQAAVRSKQKPVLLFLDLDGLKVINDQLGHELGDRALVESAALLREVFRTSDVIARLGGDEFVVLATDVKSADPEVLVSRLRQALSRRRGGGSPFELSMSIGVSVVDPAAKKTLQALLAEADAKMYAEKRSARAARGQPS